MADRPRRPTSADVATIAGVSRTTVSFVLNRRPGASISAETRRRVEVAAEELGYQPHVGARAMAGVASQTIGLVLRQSVGHVGADAFLAQSLLGIVAEVRLSGYRVLVEPLPPGEANYRSLLNSARTDGLIVSGPRTDDPELEQLVSEGFPIVIQGSLPGLAAPSVDVDNRAGARTAVEHLIGLGHRRIGCITNAPLAYTAAADRLAGYADALRGARIGFEQALVAEGGFDADSGYDAMRRLLAGDDSPTGVFVASDVVAFGALRALREAGLRVPEDVSVVGFDDIPLARHFDPPLTTIRLPAHALGVAAGRTLVQVLSGRSIWARTLLPTELVVRESTARPTRRGG